LAIDGALTGPDGFSCGLRDYGVFGGASVFVERPTFDDALSQGGEVAGTDPAIVCQLTFVGGLGDGNDAVYSAFSGEQHVADQRSRLEAGKSAQFFEDAVVEAGTVLVLAEGIAMEVDVGGDDVVGREALVKGGEMDETL
jgi:hypothetical protein